MDRPDLEEFLSALNGFIDKKSASADSSYLKFLDIFCRSVGSAEGHLLRPGPSGELESVSSFGMDPHFDPAFNEARDNRERSPLDDAFLGEKVVAIVEIKESEVPRWFYKLMTLQGFKSLVAVPIIGAAGPIGLFCAYYRDVCLFDEGTLERLLSVGRMVGGAAESASDKAPVGKAAARSDDATDAFIYTLTEKPFTKIQVFEHLAGAARAAFSGAAVICGPVRIVSGDMVITVAYGEGVPEESVSHRFSLPSLFRQQLVTGEGLAPARELTVKEFGELKTLVGSPKASVLCQAVMWQGKMQAAIVAWRPGAFDEDDNRRLGRLAAIAALALNAA